MSALDGSWDERSPCLAAITRHDTASSSSKSSFTCSKYPPHRHISPNTLKQSSLTDMGCEGAGGLAGFADKTACMAASKNTT